MKNKLQSGLVLLVLTFVMSGCGLFYEPKKDLPPIYTKIFKTDYNTGWQAVLESLKNQDRAIVNREAGVIQTAWIDNTATRNNLTDTFGESQTYLKSKYRLSVTVSPGTYHGISSVKVTIQKEQVVQHDPLESWQQVRTDSIEENTLLYRISRIIIIKQKLKRAEDIKTKALLQEGV